MTIAQANSNIALIKYWGKRDQNLRLPHNGSLSMTLDKLFTRTSVTYDAALDQDHVVLNDHPATPVQAARIGEFMDRIRSSYQIKEYAEIHSHNNFPTDAGLASSASGFAALALAAAYAAGLRLKPQELSVLARQGSGSACRSIEGGFIEWFKGTDPDGMDSYAVQLLDEKAWNICMLVVILEARAKDISSTEGMARTVQTSPLYPGWLDSIESDLTSMRLAIQKKDFTAVGTIMEHNCLKMHATALGAQPPVIYWHPKTLEIIQEIQYLREAGIECYFTIDAGPNIKILLQEQDTTMIKRNFLAIKGVQDIIVCQAGRGAFVCEE